MEKFIIGGKEYDAKITYRARRMLVDSINKKNIEEMELSDREDVLLEAILLSLNDKSFTKEALADALDNDEYLVLDKRFAAACFPQSQEGKTEIEKKLGQTNAS
jgi:hypothetical protein